jgi:hypothetical protein
MNHSEYKKWWMQHSKSIESVKFGIKWLLSINADWKHSIPIMCSNKLINLITINLKIKTCSAVAA